MNPVIEKIREVHRSIDNYTERWVEGERDEQKWKTG